MKRKSNFKKWQVIFVVMIAVLFLGTVTFAFFTSTASSKEQDANLTTGVLSLRFADKNNGINATLEFGQSVTKEFIIENTGTVDATARMSWLDLVNTYLAQSLSYNLSYSETYSETGEGYIQARTSNDNVPPSAEPSKQDLADGLVVPAGKTYNYRLTITLNYLENQDQTEDLKAKLNTKFMIDEGTPGFWDKILMNVKNGNPDFSVQAPLPISYKDGINEMSSFSYGWNTTNNPSQVDSKERYFTYSEEYTYDVTSGTYTLVNPKVGKYKDIWQDIIGKYTISEQGSASPSIANYRNLSTLVYIRPQTTLNYVHYYRIRNEALSYNYSNDGIFAMEDDYGTSYYFRGAITNNYFKFGKDEQNRDMYWRIMRINGDNSIRLVYDGTQAHINGDISEDRRLPNKKWSNYSDDNKYLGYMYGGEEGTPSTSLEEAQRNQTDSNAKKQLDLWYEKVFKETEYETYLADSIYCNDRSFSSTNTGTGYGSSNTRYATEDRIKNSTYTLKCPKQNDAFTVNDTVKGNGALKYPIGFLSADEIVLAGAKTNDLAGVTNRGYYLFKGQTMLTMSPRSFSDRSKVASFTLAGAIGSQVSDNEPRGVVPVINIKAEFIDSIKGTGSASNPYYISKE